jgi:hypothetical protein
VVKKPELKKPEGRFFKLNLYKKAPIVIIGAFFVGKK